MSCARGVSESSERRKGREGSERTASTRPRSPLRITLLPILAQQPLRRHSSWEGRTPPTLTVASAQRILSRLRGGEGGLREAVVWRCEQRRGSSTEGHTEKRERVSSTKSVTAPYRSIGCPSSSPCWSVASQAPVKKGPTEAVGIPVESLQDLSDRTQKDMRLGVEEGDGENVGVC